MSIGLQTYITNKVVSLGTMVLLIFFSYLWFGNTVPQWQFLLLCLIGFGYGHFLVGFLYQIQSFFRKPKPWQHISTFILLTSLSIFVAYFLFEIIGYAIALFIGFAYFLLHGLFNEQTLIEKQTNILVPLPYIFSLALFIFSSLAYTVPDPTFLFNRTLEFMAVDQFVLTQSFLNMGLSLNVFQYVFWSGVSLSFLILLVTWYKSRWTKLSLFLGCSYTTFVIFTILFGSIPYVYMYLLVVGYHFVTWFLFYFDVIKKRSSEALTKLISVHVLILLPFLIAGWSFLGGSNYPIVELLFDYKYFVVATYIHISVSFMNDEWFQVLQNRFFNLFEQKPSQ